MSRTTTHRTRPSTRPRRSRGRRALTQALVAVVIVGAGLAVDALRAAGRS